MTDAFSTALAFTLKWEGGFVNDPDDPGGATNKGITQAVYSAWLLKHGRAAANVRQISDEDVTAIYREQYWAVVNAEAWPARVAVVLFDTAVNMGCKRARDFLMIARNTDNAAASILDQREAFYRAIVARRPKSAKYLNGWLARTAALRKLSGSLG